LDTKKILSLIVGCVSHLFTSRFAEMPVLCPHGLGQEGTRRSCLMKKHIVTPSGFLVSNIVVKCTGMVSCKFCNRDIFVFFSVVYNRRTVPTYLLKQRRLIFHCGTYRPRYLLVGCLISAYSKSTCSEGDYLFRFSVVKFTGGLSNIGVQSRYLF